MYFNSGVTSYCLLYGERRGGKSGKQSASVLVCASTQLSPQYACSSAVLEKGWSLEQLHPHNESV